MGLPSALGIILPQLVRQNNSFFSTMLSPHTPPGIPRSQSNTFGTHSKSNPTIPQSAVSQPMALRSWLSRQYPTPLSISAALQKAELVSPGSAKLLSVQCPRWPRVAKGLGAKAFPSDIILDSSSKGNEWGPTGVASSVVCPAHRTLTDPFLGPCSQRRLGGQRC